MESCDSSLGKKLEGKGDFLEAQWKIPTFIQRCASVGERKVDGEIGKLILFPFSGFILLKVRGGEEKDPDSRETRYLDSDRPSSER